MAEAIATQSSRGHCTICLPIAEEAYRQIVNDPVEATRGNFLRPWAKRDAAIGQLQEGFNALTGLMSAVRDSLEKQNKRQDELMNVLSNLPEVMRSIPESGAADLYVSSRRAR